MIIIQLFIGIIFALGIGCILFDVFKIPSMKASRATHNLGRKGDKKVSNIKLFLEGFAAELAPKLKLNEWKKHELEEEIFSLNEEIEDQTWPIASAYELAGLIDCVVEDLWDKGDKHPAYKYNGFDLPEKTVVYANGDKDTSTPTVWCEDVYCIVEANY